MSPSAIDDDDVAYVKVTFWHRFRRHQLAVAAFFVLVGLLLCAIFAKQLAPFDPNAIDEVHWQGNSLPPCFENATLCARHLLGTDEVGRDLLSRLLFGARISLPVAVSAVLMEVMIGTMLGAIAGYYGGIVDYLLMRVTDVFLSIPLLPLLLVLTAIVAATSTKAALNFGVIVLIIGALSWPPVARLVRGASFLACASASSPKRRGRSATTTPASSSATCCRTRSHRSSFRRRSTSPTSSSSSRRSRFWASASSRRPRPGATCSPTPRANLEIAWWAAVFPGLCILVTVLAINYIGDGLRDALDPNMR